MTSLLYSTKMSSLLAAVIYWCVQLLAIQSVYSTTLYVTTHINGTDCPPTDDIQCHTLSYYISDDQLNIYFVSDTVVIFLEGTHTLDTLVILDNVTNITLQGVGQIFDGEHWSVKRSTAVINCTRPGALFFSNWTNITINSITFDNCGHNLTSGFNYILLHYNLTIYNWEFAIGDSARHTLLFINGTNLYLTNVTVQNGFGYGLTAVNSYDLFISNSWFYKNNYKLANPCSFCCLYIPHICDPLSCTRGGNIRIVYIPSTSCPYLHQSQSVVAIKDTTVSFGVNLGVLNYSPLNGPYGLFIRPNGGGIGLIPADYSCNEYRFELDNIIAFNNVAYNNGANIAMIILPVPIFISRLNSTQGCCSAYTSTTSGCRGIGLYFQVRESLPAAVSSELIIVDSNISNNRGFAGSGLAIVSLPHTSWESISISTTSFDSNIGNIGGGIYIDKPNSINGNPLLVHLLNVTVTNTIRAVSTASYAQDVSSNLGAVTLSNINCSITGLTINNTTEMRGMSLFLTKLYIFNDNIISNNQMINNSGGGIFLMDFESYLIFHPPCSLNLINNYASLYGGGIYMTPFSGFIALWQPCFFQIDDPSHSMTSQVHLRAINNTAGRGGNFYSGQSPQYCAPVTNSDFTYCQNDYYCSEPLFNDILQLEPSSIQHTQYYSFEPVGATVCTNDTIDLGMCRLFGRVCSCTTYLFPGEAFNLSIVTLSPFGYVVNGTVDIVLNSNGVVIDQLTRSTSDHCTDIEVIIKNYTNQGDNILLNLYTPNGVIFQTFSRIHVCYNIQLEQCPPGFTLIDGDTNYTQVCDCNKYVKMADTNSVCNINSSAITSNPQIGWIGYNYELNCTYYSTNRCPFDYCVQYPVTYSLNQPNGGDIQCALNRSGILCGQCSDGLSLMLGSNRCGLCTDNDGMSFVILFLASGFILVILIIVLDLTVTVGTINGLLFYVNVIKINQPLYFPESRSIPFVTQWILWLNLELGIETCFYNGLTPILKAWFQYVYMFYIFLLTCCLLIVANCCTRSKRFGRVKQFLYDIKFTSIFPTLLLVAYTKLLNTLLIVFQSTVISCDDVWNVHWRYDANIKYGQSLPHILLLLVASIVTVCYIIPYSLFVDLLPVVEKLPLIPGCGQMWLRIKPLCDAYASPYKDKFRFWTGALVMLRLILTILSTTVSPSNSTAVLYIIIFMILIILFVIIAFKGPYKSHYLSILESWFLINILIASVFALRGNETEILIGTITSAVLTFITTVGIVFWHIYRQIKDFIWFKNFVTCLKEKFKKPKNVSELVTTASVNATNVTVETTPESVLDTPALKYEAPVYRDSILGLEDDL